MPQNLINFLSKPNRNSATSTNKSRTKRVNSDSSIKSTSTEATEATTPSVASLQSTSPTTSRRSSNKSKQKQSKRSSPKTKIIAMSPSNTNPYGYEEAAPDIQDKYGYEAAEPTTQRRHQKTSSSSRAPRRGSRSSCSQKYEDPEVTPDNPYGYGEASPSPRRPINRHVRRAGGARSRKSSGDIGVSPRRSSMELMPHRSSMRSTDGSSTLRRRGSIQLGGEIEIQLPGRSGSIMRRQSITFKETAKVKNITRVTSLVDDPENLWFQQSDYSRMKRRSFELARRADVEFQEQELESKWASGEESREQTHARQHRRHSLSHPSGKKYCVRGLEHMIPSKREELLDHKYEVWYTVLDEQDIQREVGEFNDEQIANLYRSLTKKSLEEAQIRAEADQKDIEKYMRSTRRSIDSLASCSASLPGLPSTCFEDEDFCDSRSVCTSGSGHSKERRSSRRRYHRR